MRSPLLFFATCCSTLLTLSIAPAAAQTVRFVAATAIVNETAGTVSIPVSIAGPGATASTVQVALAPWPAPCSTALAAPCAP